MKNYALFICLFFLSFKALSQRHYSDTLENFDYRDVVPPERNSFLGVEFKGRSVFYSSKFSQKMYFENAKFSGEAAFTVPTFAKDVSFKKAQFLGQLDMYYSTFEKNASFSDTKFVEDVEFIGSQFIGDVSFFQANFQKKADFSQSEFSKKVDFDGAKFSANATLQLSKLRLTDSTVLTFADAVLPDTVLFAENNYIKNEIFLTSANFTDSTRYDYNIRKVIRSNVYLFNTDVSKLHLDYIHFKLFLPDSTIVLEQDDEGEKVPTVTKFISFEEKSAIYEALLSNFKTHGQTESYKLLDIEYQQFKVDHTWPRVIAWLPGWWWNFGYDKDLIFKWTALFLLVFTAFTYIFIHSLNSKVYAMEKIPTNGAWAKKISVKDFGKRLWFSFMYTATVFFKLSVKVENLEFKERRGTAYIILVYTVGLICIAYMANFVIQKG